MRCFALLLVFSLTACALPRPSEINYWTVRKEEVPPPGSPGAVLDAWFAQEGYVAGPKVRASRAELVRRPGDPIAYSTDAERIWWLTQQKTVRDLCVTAQYVYYRLRDDGTLIDAIPAVRSSC